MPVPATKAVFLSYASQDAEPARRICEALRSAGIEVWFDQSELRGGDAWDQKIKKQIRECALFLPVISANTNARAEGYFRLEWKLAVDRSHLMADDAAFLVPAVIDEISDAAARVPDKFREVQWMRVLTAEAPAAYAARVLALLSGAAEPRRATSRDSASTPASGGTTTTGSGATSFDPRLAWRPAAGQPVPGTQWTIERKLGEGGFGEVWLGRHQTMKERRVFKFCFEAERVRSLKREMTLFRVLKERVGGHPNIVRLLDVHFNEPPFYVEMDYVEGQSLKVWCEQQGGVDKIPLATRLEIVAQTADALHAAHAAGVIHRDVKPGNILIAQSATPGGAPTAMLSDFGIGQVTSDEALAGVTKTGFTKSIVAGSSAHSGTQLYMAPEVVAGDAATNRSDIYSLGVVLFQLVTGDLHRPLTTDWPRAIGDPVLREDLERCFAGRPEERFSDADELANSLRTTEQRHTVLKAKQAAEAAREKSARRWKIFRTVGVTAVVVGLVASLGWFLQRNSKLRWARETALPEIIRLIAKEEFAAAFALAREAEKHLPNDPALTSLWPRISVKATIETTPPGADVYLKPYRNPDAEWQLLGKTPLKDIRVARQFYRWQIKKEGFALLERAGGLAANSPIQISLDSTEESVPGMVRIAEGGASLFNVTGLQYLPNRRLESYLVDKYEVSNRQFKEFVNRGGYATAGFWKQPFIKPEKELTWTEAINDFRDATGRPGPATWKNGTYPDGEADFPVTGISWFEAAAYAESVGKRLPSLYHWSNAALPGNAASIVPLSNFGGRGPARVGTYQGMSPTGTYDMAGNVKEWCWNEAGPDKRYTLGGAWREPEYMFMVPDAMSPFDRAPTNGFRCIKLLSAEPLPKGVDDPVTPPSRNYANEQPVSDETFRIYKSLYSYDKTDLDARTEAVDESPEFWRREKVSFNAAYGNERVTALLFLPKNQPPPYQTVVFFPPAGAIRQPSSENLGPDGRVRSVVVNGRALILPIYKGTYERQDGLQTYCPMPTSFYRDHVIQWSKDLGRAIDYLETRKDIQPDKLAYAGTSWGASMGGLLPALEPRLKASVLFVGGFHIQTTLPEVDQINFAPRITIPTLMMNGRYDAVFPLESSQLPMFRLLGTPPEHKRHVLFDTGHTAPETQTSKGMLDWLDKYLGPVK